MGVGSLAVAIILQWRWQQRHFPSCRLTNKPIALRQYYEWPLLYAAVKEAGPDWCPLLLLYLTIYLTSLLYHSLGTN